MRHLADGLNWARLPPLEEEQGWLESEEDQVCCFYLHLLPEVWWPYHAFASPLSVGQVRKVMDWPHDEPAYMASLAPAKGWVSAPGPLHTYGAGLASSFVPTPRPPLRRCGERRVTFW